MQPLRPALLSAMTVLLVGCGTDSPEEHLMCASPDDDNAAADVTITARDSMIEPAPGERFLAWTYDGDVPGPVVRMNVGETKRIKLVNDSPRPASLHFHGVTYQAKDDGTMLNPSSMVNPGCSHIYEVTAHEPGVWPYHSHHNSRIEMAWGHHGAIIVPEPSEAPADHEYVVFAGQLGIETAGPAGEAAEAAGGARTFFMTLNGRADDTAEVIALEGDHYVASTGEMASAKVGDRVRWRVLNVSPDDAHTFHIHGHRWCDGGGVMNPAGVCPAGTLPVDNVTMLPAQGLSLEFVEDNPGNWMYHCHVIDHVNDGMLATYQVSP